MFSKKSGETEGSTTAAEGTEEDRDIDAPPMRPFSKKGSHQPTKAATGALRPEIPRRVVEIPGPPRRTQRGRPGETESRRLIVGREICLSGEITSCDKLVVEGKVEASISDARVIEVAPSGYFKGDAQVDEADISGRFEGELVAYDKLTVRAGGRISGSIRYGLIVIESGGEISGDMQALAQTGGAAGATDRELTSPPAREPAQREPGKG